MMYVVRKRLFVQEIELYFFVFSLPLTSAHFSGGVLLVLERLLVAKAFSLNFEPLMH